MPMFENGRDLHFQNSTFTYVGRDNHDHHGTKQTALSMLESRVAAGAFHNSSERFDPPKCHPRTRIAVLYKIRRWYKNEEATTPRIMWLYGPAGAGKSAIAQTIAEECHKLRTLAASFFFSRMVPGRNDATRLIATIAYQIAHDIPETRFLIQQALENDPMVFSKSLETQLDQLVTKPLLDILSNNSLSSESWPELIIIDGLDECNGGETQQAIIHCFSSALAQHALPLHVLILSRPEQPIRESFSHPDRRWTYVSLVLDDYYRPDKDIELYLKDSFNDIRQTHVLKPHIPNTWPSNDDIYALVRRSSGQFIFAATVMRYVKSPRHRPMDRLQVILGIGSHDNSAPFAELDALYMHILQLADEAQYPTILRIFGDLLHRTHRWYTQSLSEIENFLDLPSGDISLALADCHSIVHISTSSNPDEMFNWGSPLCFLHASISDFLLDASRSQRFFVDPGKAHAELTRACIRGISSSRDPVWYHSVQALYYHRQSAHMDKTLLEDLLHLNLSDLFQAYDTTYFIRDSLQERYRICHGHISWIKSMVHERAYNIPKSLLDHHLATLDHYLRGKLLSFVWPERWPEILVLTDKIQPTSHPHLNSCIMPDTLKHVCLLLGLDITNPSTCRFIFRTCPPYDADTRQLYLDFLHDRERAGEFHINQEVYAHVALQCIKYICGEPHNFNLYYREDGGCTPDFETSHNYIACQLGLIALPSILSSAAPSAELAASLRARMSAHWTEIHVARAEYLKRYDEWENQQSQLDQEVEENPRAAKRPRGLIESPKKQSLSSESMRGREQQGPTTRRGVSTARARRSSAVPSGTSGGEVLLRRSAWRTVQKT